MCFQIVERCPFCQRVTHKHAIDACLSYGKQGHTIQEKPIYSSDDCPEHYNLGIQEAGDAVSFPNNSAIRSAEADKDRHDKGLDVGKQALSFQSESNSMATPRAPQPNATRYSGPENLNATTASEADEAQDTPPADGRVGSDDLTGIPRHHSSDATQYSTDSASTRLGSCSSAATSRSSSRAESIEGDFEMDSLSDDPSIEGNIGPTLITPQRLVDFLDPSSKQIIMLLDLRVAPQYESCRIVGALNLCIPITLAKRRTFSTTKLADTFANEAQKNEFARWRECDFIIVYDANSSSIEDATCAVAILSKFRVDGWNGRCCILQGGFSQFSRSFPYMVQPRSSVQDAGLVKDLALDYRHPGFPSAVFRYGPDVRKEEAINSGGYSWDRLIKSRPLKETNHVESGLQPPLQRTGLTFRQRQNELTQGLSVKALSKPESATTSSEAGKHQHDVRSTCHKVPNLEKIQLDSINPSGISKNSSTELPPRQDQGLGKIESGDSGYESDTGFHQMCPDFQAIEEGHWSLETWISLQPTISAKYRDIMGSRNPGAIELLARNGFPTVCITCRTPKRVSEDFLRSLVAPLPVYIGQGRIRRSMHNGSDLDAHSSDSALDDDDWPPTHGQYVRRPTCGASIGVSDNSALGAHAVSLGGYIQMISQFSSEWRWYGLTCHHLLELDDGYRVDSHAFEAQIRAFDTTKDSSYLRIPRPHHLLQSPAKTTVASQISRLEERMSYQQDYTDYGDLDDTDLRHAISTLENSEKGFGRVQHSSGLCIDTKFNVQMDWLLIGDIPLARRGYNYVGSLINYKEGFSCSLTPSSPSSGQYITEKQFGTLIVSCRKWKEDHGNRCGLLSRIHGIGSETGAGEGRLASHQVGIDLEGTGSPTFEWSFKPRCELGMSGDSGTWIFTETGKLLGMIWGFNDLTGMVYYTPIYMVLDHITRVLEAQDIWVPEIQHFIPNDSGYGSPPSSRGISEPNLGA